MVKGCKYSTAMIALSLSLLLPSPALGGHEHHHHVSQPISQPVVDMETMPAEPQAGKETTITFSIKDDSGNPMQNLVVTHERILHVTIISQDLSSFAHIHPEDFGPVDGTTKTRAVFPVRYTFPRAGGYLVAADFAVGETAYSEQFSVDTAGSSPAGVLKKDFAWKKDFGQYRVSLVTSPDVPVAGGETVLTYQVTKDGKRVKDLEPYLGAAMHLAVVPADLTGFIHTHGEVPGSGGRPSAGHVHGNMAKGPFGPDIEARVIFPNSGVYKVFGEMKHEGRVVLTEFMLRVE